jgi:hypothetical protein
MIVSFEDAHRFAWAVTKAEDWLVNHGDYNVPPVGSAIEEACELMAGYKDAMPEGLYRRITDMAIPLFVLPPRDTRYSTGSVCLRNIVAKLREKYSAPDGRHGERHVGQHGRFFTY